MQSAKTIFLAAVMMTAAVAFGQQHDIYKSSGLYEYTSFTVGHDTSASWSSEMDSAVGYIFTSRLAVEAGVPFYLVSTQTTTSSTGTTTNTTHTGSLGDAFFRVKGEKQSAALAYTAILTASAPTGDTKNGVSTGRATFNWNNRLEHEFDHISPFGEASIGNSLTSTRQVRRDYTTLGAVSEFRAGASIDLGKRLSLEASGYGDVGYGNQKIYSRSLGKGNGSANAAKHNRVFQAAYLTTGSASLVNDNGITTDLSYNVTRRIDMDFAYNHSLHFADDSVAVTLGMRLGHINHPAPAAN